MERYNVIAKCADGDVMIGKNGKYEFSFDEAQEVGYDHRNMGVTLFIIKVD